MMSDENPRLFDHIPSWPLTEEDRKILPGHVLLCQEALADVFARQVPGNICECGVHAGVNLAPLTLATRADVLPRKVFACDTFDGLPTGEDSAGELSLKAGECRTDWPALSPRLKRCGMLDFIIPVKGMVEDTLECQLKDRRFSFAFLDMDLEAPTRHAAQFFTKHMEPGGLLGFHDYGFVRCPGIAKVVDGLRPQDWQPWRFPTHNTIFLVRQ